MTKVIPQSLIEYIIPFNWDVNKVWELETEVIKTQRREYDYLLELPLWSSVPKRGMLFDISPIEVIKNPEKSPYQSMRLAETDMEHPLDFLFFESNMWILDGVHRLAKHYMLNHEQIRIRIHDECVISKIKLD